MENLFVKSVENYKILVCVDKTFTKYENKAAASASCGKISKNINTNFELTPIEYKNIVESGITTMLCNVVDGAKSRKEVNYKNANSIGLDFDNNNNSDEILECFRLNGIETVFFMHKTFSYTETLKKFRVVIALDRSVNIDERCEIYYAFKMMLKNSNIIVDDIQDATRLLFGTQNKEFVCYNPTSVIDTDLFLDLHCKPSKITKDSKNVKRTVDKIEANRTVNTKQTIIETTDIKMFEKFNFEIAAENCKLFNNFINLVRLTHNELLIIASNLRWIKGGAQLYYDTLSKYNETVKHTTTCPEYSDSNYAIMKICSYYNYGLMSLKYSPFEEDQVFENLIDCTVANRVEQIENFEVVSIEDNRKTLNDIFDKVYENCLNGTAKKVNVIVSSTGTGKTNCIKKVAKYNDILYVMKTHKNIEDFVNEVEAEQNFKLYATAKLPMFENKIINDTINNFNEVKKFGEVKTFLYLIADGNLVNTSENDRLLAATYLQECLDYSKITDTIVTTASKFSNLTFKHKIAIIDECISNEYVKTGEIYLNNLVTVFNKITTNFDVKQKLQDVIDYVKSIELNQTTTFKTLNSDMLKEFYKTMVEDDINVINLLDFLQADFVSTKMCEEYGLIIVYGYNKAPKNSNMFKIIMTSTPDVDVLNMVYGVENIEYFILPETKIVGNLEQYNKHTYSKSSLRTLQNGKNERVEFVKSTIDDSFSVITYKDCKTLFKNNECDFHFGFVEGHNDLKGQNIAVVGAMQPNPHIIKIKSALLGVPLHIINKEIEKFRKIEYNGFRFSYNVYENEQMKNIKMFYIYSQLNQSIGRARLGEFDSNVFVFSSLPIKQAKLMQNKTKKIK